MPHSALTDDLRRRIAADECIILDGGIATELQRQAGADFQLSDAAHWGFGALHNAPQSVLAVHESYLAAGADVLTTNTYSVLEAPSYTGNYLASGGGGAGAGEDAAPPHWMDLARAAVALPRRAIAASGRDAAVAFSIGGDIETPAQRVTVELLLRLFETPQYAPDLILFETVSLIEDNLTLPVIEELVARGWPVWVSFRRCRQGLCGIHGQLWGGPEGDRFGRLARRLEGIGVQAVLINCLPVARVGGTLAWLRDFTDLPLGVYPNVGRYVESGWKFDAEATADGFAAAAAEWRDEGAAIVGGCCGVGPGEIAAAKAKLAGMARGKSPAGIGRGGVSDAGESIAVAAAGAAGDIDSAAQNTWHDAADRPLYPLPLPQIVVDPGVFVPTQGSYLIWKFLFNEGVGVGKRCLDVGCGVGILAIQLALNGAREVVAVDIQPEAIDNTRTNAYRNGVADKITARCEDLYSFTPRQKYDLVVASLYQMPTDPLAQTGGHRDVDYWGRNLLDHFIAELPNYLRDDGVAYLMQVSMLSAARTEAMLRRRGYSARVVDFNLYQFNPVFRDHLPQIARVEELSDAYHFAFGGEEHVMVMYLLEVRK